VNPVKFFALIRRIVTGISFFTKLTKQSNFTSMAKETKKPAKEASTTFHNIMAASVKGNPKPKKKEDKKKENNNE